MKWTYLYFSDVKFLHTKTVLKNGLFFTGLFQKGGVFFRHIVVNRKCNIRMQFVTGPMLLIMMMTMMMMMIAI